MSRVVGKIRSNGKFNKATARKHIIVELWGYINEVKPGLTLKNQETNTHKEFSSINY